MQLREVLEKLNQVQAGEEQIICAKRPWTGESEATLVLPSDEEEVPAHAMADGFSYFLEVHVALEVVKIFGAKTPSLDETASLLIYYAENDTYPDWVCSTGA